MYDLAVMIDWLGFAARWLHVITAIAWIGSSFYFIALDLGLRQAPNLPEGAYGEEWQVHGGGFYHIQKYLVAPATMPEHLTWFKWESYATWMSGFALLALLYYANADLYLIDANLSSISALTGILISMGSMVAVWFAYHYLCNSKLGENPTFLMILLYAILVALSWGYTQIFTGRASLLHLGAITATIMAANVFLVIIPNQRIVVADLIDGKKPDPKYGKIAKLRSTHNNYLTLPVLFLMLSNHYPLAFATEYNWVIASLVFLMGVTIRHYFNSLHARKGNPHWTWIVTALLFIAIMWLSTLRPDEPVDETAFVMTPSQQEYASAEGFQEVHDIVLGRCSMCHSAEPFYEGIRWAPKGVLLENEGQIAARATEIFLHSGLSTAMPPANVSFMEEDERAKIVKWYRSVSKPFGADS
jgi:uncharacterized membrane protein